MLEDNKTLTFACPKCGHIFDESIGALKMKDSITCQRCTRVFMFDQDEFRTALVQARDAIRNLRKVLGFAKR